MNTRERFCAVMDFESFDRLPVFEWAAWWDKTIDRWHEEGLPRSLTRRDEISQHFGLEVCSREWISPRHGRSPTPPRRYTGLLSAEPDYGKLGKLLFAAPRPDPAYWEPLAERHRRGEVALWLQLDGFFWFPREIFGVERHLLAFYDEADLMRQMIGDILEWDLQAVAAICEMTKPDLVLMSEDMSYNHGPMLSRAMFDDFMRPAYERMSAELRKRGILTFVDSDGNIQEAVGWFESAGVEGVLPLERQSGVDVAAMRRDHPRMRFVGAFDKMCMNRGEEAIRAEFERLLPVARQGGFVVSVDHQTPPGVSYDQFHAYLRLYREYAERAGRERTAPAPL